MQATTMSMAWSTKTVTDGAASFEAYSNKGDGLRGIVYLPQGNTINDIAHESFHALQH